MQPVITIIVPIYNSSKYLKECLDSILIQTFKEWVCYLINDGSTDNSQNIIDEYCKKDVRFISFIKPNERSADLTRKYGIERSKTDLIMQIDSDDAVEPDFVKKMYNRLVESAADLVCASVINCKNGLEGEVWRTPVKGFDMNKVLHGEDAFLMTIGGWGLSANCSVFKKKLLNSFVIYGKYMNSDELSQRQLLYYSNKVAVSDAEYYYRSNEGTSLKMSDRLFDRTMVDCELVDFVKDKFPNRKDKICLITRQHFFNLVHLIYDFEQNKHLFSKSSVDKIEQILQNSFYRINKNDIFEFLHWHYFFVIFGLKWFWFCSWNYVKIKDIIGQKYSYR